MFERPNQNQEHTITPQFLAEQIALPREERNEDFNNYVAGIVQEEMRMRTEETPEKTLEEERRATFDRYVKGLALSPDDLKDKVIMDIGSGDGEFVEELVDRGITKEAYGIDVHDPQEVEKYKEHFFRDTFEKPLPVKNADYAVSVGAISNFGAFNETGEDKEVLEKLLKNALAAIKETGEVRIYPIQRASHGSELIGLEESYQRWQEVLSKLATEENAEWELRPIDIRVAGNDMADIWLDEMLRIKKRQAQQP